MSEPFKVNPNLISKHKPESIMGERLIGMVPLDKAFFERLRASLPKEGLPAFYNFIKFRPQKGKEGYEYMALLNLIPYIKDQDIINSLVSYFIDKPVARIPDGFVGYLSANSDKMEHHRLYSTAHRKLLRKEGEDGILPQEDFQKDDSQLTLLGGIEFGKHIIRYITKESFDCWKEAFLAKKVWENNGFNYVPIEPMSVLGNGDINIVLEEGGYVGVVAVVLGKNAFDFMRDPKNKHFNEEIELQEKKIEKVLRENLGIDHGHVHQGNFCVGKVGNSIRVYMIDFDRAKKIQ